MARYKGQKSEQLARALTRAFAWANAQAMQEMKGRGRKTHPPIIELGCGKHVGACREQVPRQMTGQRPGTRNTRALSQALCPGRIGMGRVKKCHVYSGAHNYQVICL